MSFGWLHSFFRLVIAGRTPTDFCPDTSLRAALDLRKCLYRSRWRSVSLQQTTSMTWGAQERVTSAGSKDHAHTIICMLRSLAVTAQTDSSRNFNGNKGWAYLLWIDGQPAQLKHQPTAEAKSAVKHGNANSTSSFWKCHALGGR